MSVLTIWLLGALIIIDLCRIILQTGLIRVYEEHRKTSERLRETVKKHGPELEKYIFEDLNQKER